MVDQPSPRPVLLVFHQFVRSRGQILFQKIGVISPLPFTRISPRSEKTNKCPEVAERRALLQCTFPLHNCASMREAVFTVSPPEVINSVFRANNSRHCLAGM